MSKLIYADEVKKRFPIMENDFGMVVNETLHKELDKIPTVKAIPLEKINKAIEEMKALADPKNTILGFNEKMGLKTAMNILLRNSGYAPDTNVGSKKQAEPCEDAVSRKKLERLKRWRFSYDTNTTIPKSDLFVRLTDIRALPNCGTKRGDK